MDDFNSIASRQIAMTVTAARHNFPVDFDGDPARAKAGLFEQMGERRGRCNFAFMAIEDDVHPAILIAQGERPHATHACVASGGDVVAGASRFSYGSLMGIKKDAALGAASFASVHSTSRSFQRRPLSSSSFFLPPRSSDCARGSARG